MLPILLIIGLIGILAGGIVNALADDLPRRRKPSLPHYPDGSPRPVSAWLGLSAFATNRRTSPTGSTLSWRHPITEIAVAVLMMLVAQMALTTDTISDVQLVFYLIYMAIFVLITVIDIEHRLILFVVIIPSVIIALLDALLTPQFAPPDLKNALIGGALGFGVFFVMYLGGFLFTYLLAILRGRIVKEVAFGYGDVMLAGLCGLIIGWEQMIIAMFLTVFLGAIGALIYIIIRSFSGRYNLFTPLPYGPYIVIGTLMMLLFKEPVLRLLMGIN